MTGAPAEGGGAVTVTGGASMRGERVGDRDGDGIGAAEGDDETGD